MTHKADWKGLTALEHTVAGERLTLNNLIREFS